MAVASLLSVEEFLKTGDGPSAEFRDGIVTTKPMTTMLHGLIASLLAAILWRQNCPVMCEVLLRLSPTKYLLPDLIAAPEFEDAYPTKPVLLCIEILSPDDRLGAALAKCEEYHDWGVPCCWVIDPIRETAWDYQAGREPVRLDRHSGTLRVHEFTVSLEELFSRVDAVRTRKV